MFRARLERRPSVECWGPSPEATTRDFLFVEDAAAAIVRAVDRLGALKESAPAAVINVGTGHETSIATVAAKIKRLVGYEGELAWDPEAPRGQARRCLDVTRARDLLDWQAATPLDVGLKKTVDWYRSRAFDQTAVAREAQIRALEMSGRP
jgi:nucleoside-diphosphate-sugar epimerase